MKSAKPKRIELNPCLGIPVRFDPNQKTICESRGLGFLKKVFVGPAFLAFPPREQQALLLHEVGHCKLRHLEKRIVALLTPWRTARVCREQEFEADRFAAGCGYGADLARAFLRIQAVPDPLHPPKEERIRRLIHA